MFKLLAQIFGQRRQPRIKEVHDPLLGDLRLADEEWWESSVLVGGKKIGFKIGGDTEPHPQLVAHAREIVSDFPRFEKMVMAFVAEECNRMQLTPDQIRQLVIADVMLCWPDKPNDGMIYFSGLEDFGVWRCDYINRKPRELGFDS